MKTSLKTVRHSLECGSKQQALQDLGKLEAELHFIQEACRQNKVIDGTYTVTYVTEKIPTVYIDIEKILGDSE